MKKIVLLLILACSINAQAGGFQFPNVEFDYAKVYLFNLNLDKPNGMDFRIYKDGVYANSKLGNGTLLSDEFHEKVRKTFAKGVDELIVGLGKCYMPRHGIIYYNSNHEPVASLSICFECDKISVWSKEPYHFSDEYRRFNYDKAEEQMRDLAKFLKAETIPVYTSASEEKKYIEYLENDTSYKSQLHVEIEAEEDFVGLPALINDNTAKAWAHVNTKLNYKEKIDTVGNTDGTSNIYHQVNYPGKNSFNFIDGQLINARIEHPDFILPKGVSTGMSVVEFYKKMGFSTPKEGYPLNIELSGKNWIVSVGFNQYQTLSFITIEKKM